MDNLSHGGRALFPLLGRHNFQFVKGDVVKRPDVKQAVDKVDAVIHLAAIVGDPACAANPTLAQEVNFDGSALLFEEACRAGVKTFVFASTCSNYGKMPEKNGYVDESSALKPVSHYARLKVDFERFLIESPEKGICCVALRFATAFGLSLRPRLDLTVNEFAYKIATGQKLEVYGENFWRPYCHVSDLARGCILTLQAGPETIDRAAMNVGSTDENYQKKTIVKLILRRKPEMAGNVSFVTRDEDPRDYRVRFEKIKRLIGFDARRSVPDGIGEFITASENGFFGDGNDPFYRNIF